MPKFSILMNCYNGEKYLQRALDSVFAQTYSDWEIIFVDNQSTDNSVAIAEAFGSKVHVYRTNVFCQLGQARNIGLKHCTGQFVAFLDVDDLWMPSKLQVALDAFESEKIDFFYSDFDFIDEFGSIISRRKSFQAGMISAQDLLKNYQVNFQSLVLRNDRRIEFDQNLRYAPDYKLCLEVSLTGFGWASKERLVQYRVHTASLSNKTIGVWGLECNQVIDSLEPALLNLVSPIDVRYARARAAHLTARFYIEALNQPRRARQVLKEFSSTSLRYRIYYWLAFLPCFWRYIYHGR